MSSTSPVSSSKVTRSPIRIGWVIASRIPAIAFASVWRAAKPTTRPSTADDARMPVATLSELRELRGGDGDADQEDHREDQPADEPQARARRRATARRASRSSLDALAALRDQRGPRSRAMTIATTSAMPALDPVARLLAAAV